MTALVDAHRTDHLAEWKRALDALEEDRILPIHADPEASAITALLVADFVDEPRIARTIAALASAGMADPKCSAKVKGLARTLLELVERPGGRTTVGRAPPDTMMQEAQALAATMVDALTEASPGSVEVRLWLDAIRRGQGVLDLIFDLRALAHLAVTHGDALERGEQAQGRRGGSPADLALAARRMATALENHMRDDRNDARATTCALLERAWTLFVPAYEELCRVGRFASDDATRDRCFPPLAMISAHQRAKRRPTSILPPRAPAAPSRAVEEVVCLDERDEDDVEEVKSLRPPSIRPPSAVPPPASAPPPPSVSPSVSAAPDPFQTPAIAPPPGLESDPEPSPEPLAGDPALEEPRRSRRHSVQVEVGVSSDSNLYVGFTENVSDSGVFIATYRPQPIGSDIDLELHLPSGTIHASGIVRWLRVVDACEDWPGMGVQFDRLREEDARRIRDFIRVRDPLFFEAE